MRPHGLAFRVGLGVAVGGDLVKRLPVVKAAGWRRKPFIRTVESCIGMARQRAAEKAGPWI
jgi:hypothetical protein